MIRVALIVVLVAGACVAKPPVERAWDLAGGGHASEAIELLRQLTRTEPLNVDAHLLLGSLLMEQGVQAECLEHLTAAVRIRPNSDQAQIALGEAYSKFGQQSQAQTAFERAVALKPNSGVAQLDLGQVLLQRNALTQAAGHLDRAASLLGRSDDAADAHYLLAKVYAASSDWPKASEHLEEAVRIRPRFGEAWSDLGQARKGLLNDPGALEAFEKAVSISPGDGIAQYRLGAEFVRRHEYANAIPHLRTAKELNPGDQSILNSLQLALRLTGDTAGANEVKQELVALLRERDQINQNRLNAVKLNNEGATLERTGNLASALEKYREASQLDPNHNGIRVNLGVALLRTGHWTDGLEQLHTALLRDAGNAQIRATLKDALAQAPRSAIPDWAAELK